MRTDNSRAFVGARIQHEIEDTDSNSTVSPRLQPPPPPRHEQQQHRQKTACALPYHEAREQQQEKQERAAATATATARACYSYSSVYSRAVRYVVWAHATWARKRNKTEPVLSHHHTYQVNLLASAPVSYNYWYKIGSRFVAYILQQSTRPRHLEHRRHRQQQSVRRLACLELCTAVHRAPPPNRPAAQ